MKKLLGIWLALALVLGGIPVLGAETEAVLPDVGETVNGFTVTERGVMNLIDAETVMFEHDKTGAQVLYIAAEDTHRSFDITFKTPTLDNKGIPHIFEHATISGSEKYPSQNLFFPLLNRTYNTFANALTLKTATTYPSASLSEEQLLKLADYYLDGVFNPLLMTEERIFDREAWRYELADAESPITISGTVYNEAKGVQTIDWNASFNVLDALFPGTIVPNQHAGHPDYITDMTWQDLRDFHDAYYHPSNSLTILYGDLDYAAFLRLMDEEYFSEYDRAEIIVETGLMDPLEAMSDKTYYFPVESGSSTQDASIIIYAGAANGATFEDKEGLYLLSSILNEESSALRQAINAALPSASVSVGTDITSGPTAVFSIQASGVNESDKGTFMEVVETALAQIAEEGVDPAAVDAALAAERFTALTFPESPTMFPSLGAEISYTTAVIWSLTGSVNYYNDYLTAIEAIEEKADEGYFEGLITQFMLDNPHKAIVATVPEAGKAEEAAAALEAELAELKAGMTEDEIAAMVAEAEALAAWSVEEAPEELVQSLQAVDAQSLPEEAAVYDITERDEDGVHYMTVETAGDIGSTDIILDTSAVPVEELHYLSLYSSLMGQLGTASHPTAELGTLKTRYLHDFSLGASTRYTEDGYAPIFMVYWTSLNGEYAASVELVQDILQNTDMTDAKTIQNIVGRLINSQRSNINSYPYQYQYYRALAASSEMHAYTNYINSLEYYQFLIETEKMLDTNPEQVLAGLASIQEKVMVKANANVLFAGNADGIALMEEHIGQVFEGMAEEAPEPADYTVSVPAAASEAIVIDSAVQYNLIYAPLASLNVEDSGKLQVLARIVYDMYLTPQIRHNIGAYDNLSMLDKNGFAFISYRDPSIAETFQVYEGLSDFIASAAITQDDIDDYILSVYSGYALPTGARAGAIAAMENRLAGFPDDLKLQTMREIKSFTPEDVLASAEAFGRLAETGFRSTAGGAAMIGQYAGLYESIINVSEMNPDSDAGLTLGGLVSLLFGGVEGAYETAAQMGIIGGEGFEEAAEETAVTREQFAVILLRALQLPETAAAVEIADADTISAWAKTAVDSLLGYGLLTLDDAGNFNPQAAAGYADYEAVITAVTAMSEAAA